EEHGFDDVPVVRLEELHPFPFESLMAALGRYAASEIAWVQEEPWNMGGWGFVSERLRRVLPAEKSLRYVGRRESASPATGSYRRQEEGRAEFVREAFAPRAVARGGGA